MPQQLFIEKIERLEQNQLPLILSEDLPAIFRNNLPKKDLGKDISLKSDFYFKRFQMGFIESQSKIFPLCYCAKWVSLQGWGYPF